MAESKIKKIPELIKLEYTLFVLPFVYIGMLLAGIPTLVQFILITIALVCARGAAFAANRYFGWNYDVRNPKKADAPNIKTYSKNELLLILAAFVIIFLSSAYLLNSLAFALAPLIVILLVIEPHFKKYTEHRHLTMGLIIGLGILGGYIGMSGTFPLALPIYVLLAGYAFFSAGNDIIYTLNHVDFDKTAGLKTYPAKYGIQKSLNISLFFHIISATLFILFAVLIGSVLVLLGAVAVFVIFMLEHRRLDHKDSNSLKISFFNYNALISILFMLSVVGFKILLIFI